MDSKISAFLLCWMVSAALSSDIRAKGDTSVTFGQDASFSCSLSDPKGVSQITWQRVYKNSSIQDLATYSKVYGENVMEPKVVFSEASLNSSSITMRGVSFADEACYVCTFHVYPSGSVTKQTCLTVQGISAVRTEWLKEPRNDASGQQSVLLRCTATGKPAPKVIWSDVAFMEVGVEEVVQNQDGTATVSLNVTITEASAGGSHVDCVATAPGGDSVTARVNLTASGADEHGVGKRNRQLIAALLVTVVVLVAAVVIVLEAKREKGCVRRLLSHNGRSWMAWRWRSHFPIFPEQERIDVDPACASSPAEKLPCACECV